VIQQPFTPGGVLVHPSLAKSGRALFGGSVCNFLHTDDGGTSPSKWVPAGSVNDFVGMKIASYYRSFFSGMRWLL